jgi:transposase
MDIHGVGPVVAARILADVGDIARFANRNRFASRTGTARLAADPMTSRELPRHVDLVVHERLVHRRHVNPAVLAHVDRGRGAALDKSRRQVTAFLRRHARLPAAVDKALFTATSA